MRLGYAGAHEHSLWLTLKNCQSSCEGAALTCSRAQEYSENFSIRNSSETCASSMHGAFVHSSSRTGRGVLGISTLAVVISGVAAIVVDEGTQKPVRTTPTLCCSLISLMSYGR